MPKKVLIVLSWLLAIFFLIWALKFISFEELTQTFHGLSLPAVVLWLGFNVLVMVGMGVRWGVILKTLGYPVSLLEITKYRLVAFSVSYFTPGPHFGGEPFQIYFLKTRHQVSLEAASASVALDKLFDLIFNFGFLLFCAGFLSVYFIEIWFSGAYWAIIIIFLLPLLYLVRLFRGKRRSQLSKTRSSFFNKIYRWFYETENEMVNFISLNPRSVYLVCIISLGIWLSLIIDIWIALWAMGLSINFTQAIFFLTTLRISMLTPLPGSLGALEAGQIFAMNYLGFGPEQGIGLSLLIRGRDVLFGILGLLIFLKNKNRSRNLASS